MNTISNGPKEVMDKVYPEFQSTVEHYKNQLPKEIPFPKDIPSPNIQNPLRGKRQGKLLNNIFDNMKLLTNKM
jgi:hypothetical protein